ncbi:Protein kinase C and casein kinase substrate in neurons protein 1 [Hondaea fermentalgiana]|uniref:Protein kinase C and casein kinase substrate in neurons protein 1 n=1 Tax=Hondaea fermentalgiana TaxID=2315210 RepID=A0A2R5GXK6_9STRA|nr:Protein kinase C and casein kinase substrate in neurons protein 1 [Hondaea fermentalgiana]|eukprot:GBG33433.1 Protein kinase C and casein kinase substrate in neurons protein 1 [Hondaea fermentalgiana]
MEAEPQQQQQQIVAEKEEKMDEETVAESKCEGDYALLWADVDTCIAQANARVASLKALAGTFSQAAQLEEQHAQSLGLYRKKNPLTQQKSKNTQQQKGATSAPESTLENALVSFGCVFVDNLIKSRVVMAHEYATLGKKLGPFRADQKKAQKQLVADNTRLDKQLQAQRYILQRSRNKYFKACREAEKLIEQRDRTDLQRSPAEILKLQTKAAEQIDTCFQAERMHKQVVHETRRAQERHRAAKEKLAKEFQALERIRALRIRSTLARVAQVHIEQAEYMRSLLGDLDKTAGQIEADRDLAGFVEALTGGVAPDIQFEDFVRFESEKLDKSVRERRGSTGGSMVALGVIPSRSSLPPAGVKPAPASADTTSSGATTNLPEADHSEDRDPSESDLASQRADVQNEIENEASEQAQPEGELVQASFAFEPMQDDMIALAAGDVVRVIQKDPCGWWTGERVNDGACGLFPSNYVTSIENCELDSTLPSAA